PTGFITADHWPVGRHAQPCLRATDLLQQAIGRSGGNLPQARLLPEPSREPEFPRALTQLERQQQRRSNRGGDCRRLLCAGQGAHGYAPLRVVFHRSVTTWPAFVIASQETSDE